MSQPPGLARARTLLPGRTTGGYGNLIAARVRKLAAARSTGMLPFTGGAVYFADGDIAGAESARTPAAPRISPPLAEDSPFWLLAALLHRAEPVVDAALDLLSSEARFGRFRPAGTPAMPLPQSIPADMLLTEVARRQRLLKRMSSVLTPDTTIVRSPALEAARVRISPPQWALLIRAGDGATPRGLATELGRSVFGTTVDVYRLLAVRLLSVPVHADDALPGLSYIQAIADPGGTRP
jgi:hypothetical protein